MSSGRAQREIIAFYRVGDDQLSAMGAHASHALVAGVARYGDGHGDAERGAKLGVGVGGVSCEEVAVGGESWQAHPLTYICGIHSVGL